MHRFTCLVFLFAFAGYGQSQSSVGAPRACPALIDLHLADMKITKAVQYAAGEFPTPPGAPESTVQAAKLLPGLCRVVAEITPTTDSTIKMELWLPAEHWNGRFRGQGNGGFAGEIPYQAMGLSAIGGYATAGTDTGHTGQAIDASWANGHPEKIADFGYRAIHLMTLRSKEIVAAYYRTAAKHSYFSACSDGGREALMEAQRFPADYDGILAGAPANNWTALLTSGLKNLRAQSETPGSYVPPSKLTALTAAVMAKCDAKGGSGFDGVADGLLADPQACKFQPSEMLCRGQESDSCLTAAQVKTVETFYDGVRDKDGNQIFPGLLPGGESDAGGWSLWVTGQGPGTALMPYFTNGFYSDMVFAETKPPVDFKTQPIDEMYQIAKSKSAADLDANDANLKPFFSRGGKLILYHGWNDPGISPLNTIDYYGKVAATTGERETETSSRLYMAPGMGHCEGGAGPDSFGQYGWLPSRGVDDPKRDLYLALEQWTEGGVAPAEIIATKYVSGRSGDVRMTRPLCPYPQVAKYKGTGDVNKAESFVCAGAK